MSTRTMELEPQTHETAEPDPFDLDIRVIEFGDRAATLIQLTDDGCGSTCPKACATNPG
jgi:FxLD family lantipeptide